MRRIVSVGECMIEFSRRPDGLWAQGFAGDTLNVAWAARALSPPEGWRVNYLSRVGTDKLSGAMLAFLEKAGIGTEHIRREADRRAGLYTIETDASGERSFAYWRGESAARRLADDPAALAAGFAGADLVYFSGITLAILAPDRRAALLEAIGRRGARPWRAAFDPNIRPALWESHEAARRWISGAAHSADLLLPSFDDEERAFGDASPEATLDRYADLGVPEIVVKNGPAPTWAFAEGRRFSRAPAPVKPVDTTGAGDGFNGAWLARRLLGDAPEAAMTAAQRVSAAVVGVRGALLEPQTIRQAALRPSA